MEGVPPNKSGDVFERKMEPEEMTSWIFIERILSSLIFVEVTCCELIEAS